MKKVASFFFALLFATAMNAANNKKDTTVVFTTTPQMHCEQCEIKIKNNLRFEKGVKDIQTNVGEQTVTVTFNKRKTNSDNIQKGFEKFGYHARKLKAGEKVTGREPEGACTNM